MNVCVASMYSYLCPCDSRWMFAVIFPCVQSKYQRVPAEEALQAVDLSSSRDSLPQSASDLRCVVQVAVQRRKSGEFG